MASTRVDASDFVRASKALKAAGDRELRREFNKEVRRAVRPLTPLTRAAARETLPKSGGLAEIVARAPQRVQIRTGRETAGVRLVVVKRAGGAAWATNEGVVRHPVFGDRSRFVEQKVPGGWFDETLEKHAPTVARPAVAQAVENVLRNIVREVN